MTNDFDAICRILAEEDDFIIVTHENPDGDALGSTFAMLNLLHENGKRAELLIPESLPSKYLELAPATGLLASLPISELNSKYSYCISLDLPRTEKVSLGNFIKFDEIKIPVLNIDHHIDNPGFGTLSFVDPSAAAAAEIVFRILNSLEWKLSSRTATCLMTGIVMDTGGYRFHNTSPETFKIASELLKAGAEYVNIINKMFFSRPLGIIKLESEIILHHVKFEFNGRYAWAYLAEELLKKNNISVKEIEGLIDVLRSVEGTEVVALFYRKNDGFKFSLRSKNSKYPVGRIARAFNGGGHELAAGGFLPGIDSIEKAASIISESVEKLLDEKI